ncbi:DNA invertase [Vibrio phage 166E36-1]
MRKFGYKRCSTNEDKQDVGRQLFDMTFDKEFIEYASGKNEQDRPIFRQLLGELKSGDHVYFQELSRAGRNAAQLLSTIDDLVSRKVTVHFISESLTLTGDSNADGMAQAISKMIVTVMSAMNEFFLTQTKVAVKQGLKKAVAEGKKLGGANPKQRESFERNKQLGLHKKTKEYSAARENRVLIAKAISSFVKTVQSVNCDEKGIKLVDIATHLNNNKFKTPRGGMFAANSVGRLVEEFKINRVNGHMVVNV